MLNKIIHFSLYNRLVVLILSGLILVGGTIALIRSEIDIFPDLNAPTVVIMTEATGLAPEEVERLVTFPVETAVNGATGIRRVRSSSAMGFSVVWAEFNWETDIYRARQIVSERIATLAQSFPAGVKAPTLGPQSSILGEIMIIGLTVNDSIAPAGNHMGELRSIADRDIRPRLLSISGVSQVSVIGGDVSEYQILLNPALMKKFDVTLDDVLAATDAINENAVGGTHYEFGNEYIIKGVVNTRNCDDLAKTVVKSNAGSVVTLNDIAEVAMGASSPRLGSASVKARPAVLLTVTKQPLAATIQLTDRIEEELHSIAATLPPYVQISDDIFRQSDFISNSVSNLQSSLLEGALMVIIVLFFFLMNLRTTIVSLVSLPMSIIITVLILRGMNVTINTMTLGGIAIAIGSLVDDAIVDVENVYKRLRENRHRPESDRQPALHVIYEASKEVRTPIFNSSLIIVASFIPLFFLSGIEGRMLIPLGVAFIVALAASTVVALTLTPVLCSYMLSSDKATGMLNRQPWLAKNLRNAYSRSLEWCLLHGKVVITITAALFISAVILVFTLGRGFLPPFNEGSMTINVSTLPGFSLEESDRVGRMAEEIILATPEVRTVARKTGRAELDEHSLGVNVSEIEAPYTLSGRSRNEMVRDVRRRLSEIPGVNIEIGQPISHRIDAMLSGSEAQIAIKVFGTDLNKLFIYGREISTILKEIPGVTDVNLEQQMERPQLKITPRRELLARYGITPGQFARTVDVALAGMVVGEVYDGNLPYNITLKFNEDSRNSIAGLADIMIDSNVGKIPLSYVADIESTTGPNTINRENVGRRIVISANVDGSGNLSGIVDKIRQRIDSEIQLPEGYHVTYGGQFENEARASRTLALATIIALLVIFMLLYADFRNLSQSMVILINMPLAMIGGVWILKLTGNDLNIPAIIGFISLLGIATRNGMLLMSRYNQLQIEGETLEQRVRSGSTDRLIPIVMTALTSALALIPLALRSGVPGNEIQSPLALVILGGLVSSTTLNIFVVPVLYKFISTRKKPK
ncbi:MAG: efflux RND transporter permease subunit [bacterium]|nr:efflux RND transporter permease subunit [bacterium]